MDRAPSLREKIYGVLENAVFLAFLSDFSLGHNVCQRDQLHTFTQAGEGMTEGHRTEDDIIAVGDAQSLAQAAVADIVRNAMGIQYLLDAQLHHHAGAHAVAAGCKYFQHNTFLLSSCGRSSVPCSSCSTAG